MEKTSSLEKALLPPPLGRAKQRWRGEQAWLCEQISGMHLIGDSVRL